MWKRIGKFIKKRKTKGFTIMVVPNAEGNIRTISIPFFALLIIMAMVVVNIYVFVCYPLQISKQDKLTRKIREKQRQIHHLKRQLSQIEPSLRRTEDLTQRINEQRQLEAEVRNFFQNIRNKVSRRGVVSRSYRPSSIKVPSQLMNETKDLDTLQVLDKNLQVLEKEVPEAKTDLEKLLRDLKSFSMEYDHTPTIWPSHGRITSGFGGRIHPVSRRFRQHTGVDIKVRTGTQVRAAADGVIQYSGYRRGYGWTVIIHHGYGYETLYGHNSQLMVESGDRVSKGSVIALSGSSGTSTGPHLHYEVLINNQRVNPISFLGR